MRVLMLMLLLTLVPAHAVTWHVTLDVWPPDATAEALDSYGQWVRLGPVAQPVEWNTDWNSKSEGQVRLTVETEHFVYPVPVKYFTGSGQTWTPPTGRRLPLSWPLYLKRMAPWFALYAAIGGLGIGSIVTAVRRRLAMAARLRVQEEQASIDPWLGRTLAGCKLEERIGEGGMATVYKARREATGELLAVKLLRKGLAEDGEFCSRFQREVRLLSRLSHPSIIRVYDYSSPGDPNLFYTMELVDGGTLRQHMGPLIGKPKEILKMVRPIFEAVAYAHDQGIVHRDLKPDNILVLREGGIKVMDFGVARASADTILTQTGSLIGTPRYFPPEIVMQSGGVVDARSDQYSLGIMVYEMLAGRPPFDADNVVALVLQHQSEPPPPLRAAMPRASAALEATVARMMQKNPVDRFPDLHAALSALEAALLESS